MTYSQPITKIITIRKSTRTFDDTRKIEKHKLDQMNQAVALKSRGIFRFHIITHIMESKNKKVKLGTYGMISGARHYLVGIMSKETKDNIIEFGKAFESLVLKATDLGLGTCWMVSTYKARDFVKVIKLNANEHIVMVSPLGYAREKKRLVEKIVRKAAKSHIRKSWEQLFFIDDIQTPLTLEHAKEYAEPLEMVRLAPSAANTQPWRVVKQNNFYHFFLDNPASYKKSRFNCGYNDVGIAMYHFEKTAKEKNLQGEWIDTEPSITINNELEYIKTWKII